MPHPGAPAGGHVVLCGLNELGYRMVEQLHDLGVPVVAAERHEGNRYLPAVRRLETALNVQALNPEVRVVQQMFEPELAARVERAFGIHISHSPRPWPPPPSRPPRPASTCWPPSPWVRRSWPWSGSG